MLPFVSVLTPTRNRRAYIPQLLRCYRLQDYPVSRRELIILDDGEDSIEDMVRGVEGVVYVREGADRPIGAKRNRISQLARGDIHVNMDDDDYYPPTRVSHAVSKLTSSGLALAGSSQIILYYPLLRELAYAGPYAPLHATANTMAYTREYLRTHRFDDACRSGEEPVFTNNFSEKLVQLDPALTTILIAHDRNTYDKYSMVRHPLKKKLKELVQDKESLQFYRYELPKLIAKASVS